jgi:hypothetical protein
MAAKSAFAVPEERTLLHDVSWDTYERLLADHLNSSVPHFNFDRGILEIISPSSEHEEYTWVRELAIAVRPAGY